MPSRDHLDKIGRKKKKKWTEEAMEHALTEVKSGRCTVRKAAKEFGVPKSSLGDRVSGRVTPGSRSGPAQLITSSDEELLVEFSLHVSKHGFPLTKQQLLSFASSIYKRQHRRVAFSKLGQTWWLNFRKRQEKNITIQARESLSRARTLSVSKDSLDTFFQLLSSVVEVHALGDDPGRIWSCDEMAFGLARKRALLPKAAGLAACGGSTPRDRVSVLACFSAAGKDIPPLIVYSKAYPRGACYKMGGPPRALYGRSDSGRVTPDLFKKWFLGRFLLHAPKERPLLLLFDGHKSPVELQVVEAARREGVVLLCVPPQCPSLQPLDAGLFPLIKRRFAALAGDMRATHVFAVSKKDFSSLFRGAYQVAQQDEGISVVKEAFQKCGMYPVSRFSFYRDGFTSSHKVEPEAEGASSLPQRVGGSLTAPGL